MFDFGFSEVLLTSVIALIVLGPEKLPRAASQVGRWVGRARAMARQFREQLEEEVNLENVKKAHKEEEAKREAEATRTGSSTESSSTAGQDPAGYGAGAGGSATNQDPASWQAAGAAPRQPTEATHDAASAQTASPALPGSGHAIVSHGAGQAENPYTQPAATPTAAFSSPISPDPADFRADTFSHAHPTDEFGANPLTANGAAEPTPPPVETARDSAASEAPPVNATASAPPHRPDEGEAYASTSTPTAETSNTAHSTTPPEKSGPA